MKKLAALALSAFLSSPFLAGAAPLDKARFLEAVENGDDAYLQEVFAGPNREEAIRYHDSHGHTPIDYALLRTTPLYASDSLLLLIRTGMQPGSANASPGLVLARQIACGDLPRDIDPAALNEKLPGGMTPFLWACALADPATIQRLIAAGADLYKDAGMDDTPDENALVIAAARSRHPEVIDLLIKNGSDVESTSSIGMGALSVACMFNELPAIGQALIRAGANVRRTDGVSGTPFQYAAKHAYALPLLKDLAARGADVFACDDAGYSAMHEAARNNPNPEVLTYLLSLGLPLEPAAGRKLEDEEFTPMMLAARHNPSPDFIRAMIAARGDLERKDSAGHAAFEGLSKARAGWLMEVGLGSYLR